MCAKSGLRLTPAAPLNDQGAATVQRTLIAPPQLENVSKPGFCTRFCAKVDAGVAAKPTLDSNSVHNLDRTRNLAPAPTALATMYARSTLFPLPISTPLLLAMDKCVGKQHAEHARSCNLAFILTNPTDALLRHVTPTEDAPG